MPASSELQTQELLEAITVNVQNGDDIDALIGQADVSGSEVEEFVDIIRALRAALTPVQPRPEFADQLHAELLDGRDGLLGRLRQLPARVQIAAILTICAGFLLVIMRRLFGSDSAAEIQEEAVATPL